MNPKTAPVLALRGIWRPKFGLEDLRIELERPFEHEARLTELLVRQRELLKRLDLDKDEAGTARADADEPRMAA